MRYHEIIENDEEDMFGQSDRVGNDLRRVTYQQRIPSMVKMIQQTIEANAGPFIKQIAAELGRDADVFRRDPEIFELADDLLTQEVMPQVTNILLRLDPAVISDEDALNDALTDHVANIRAESELWIYVEEILGEAGDDDAAYACAMTIEGEIGALLLKLIQHAYSQLTLAEAKTAREEFEGMTIEMVKNGHVLVINALDDWGNKVLGSVAFNIGDDNDLDPQDLKVDERYQGQGIARIMYDYAKSKGYEIHRSYDQTDAGAGFWNKHRGEDVRVWEAFDKPYKGKWEKSEYSDSVDMLVKLPDGTPLSIMFNMEYDRDGNEVVQVEFHRNNSQDVTGEGDAQRIFATVLDAIQKYIKKYKPQRLSFSASKAVDMDADDNGAQFNPESRAKLYDRLVQRYSKALGYRAFRADNGDIVIYELSRIKQGVAEGKQPGKPVVDAILKVMPVTQEIWFHGSRATGGHRRNSDTDILVVVPDDLVGDQYLAVVRILQKLALHFDNYDIQPTKAGTNIHRIAQEEGRLLWSSKPGVAEDVPQPGPSSGAPKQFGPDAKIQTKQMTVKEIIASIPGLPYYNNVVDDYDAKDYSWGVTQKVMEYATYLKQHPESLAKLPPILVLNGKFEDGAHRVSAIWLLQQRMDRKNPFWANAKLNVQFVKQGIAEEQLDELKIDNRNGKGAVPHNQDVDYFGLRVKMKPSMFLKLALPLNVRDDDAETIDHLAQVKDTEGFGAPFLDIKFPKDWFDGDISVPARVAGHDGRHRMLAILKSEGDDPVEVHLFPRDGVRGRDITDEMIKALEGAMVSQSGAFVRGPIFGLEHAHLDEAGNGLIYRGYPCTKDCSGHIAGHMYADYWKITDPGMCPYGNSNSFWEGCRSASEEQ